MSGVTPRRALCTTAGKMDPYGEDMPPILRAAYEGDAHGTLRRAIADCADLNVEDEDGYTALHWLCTNRPHVYDDTVPHGTPDRLACISALLEAVGADGRNQPRLVCTDSPEVLCPVVRGHLPRVLCVA